MTHSGFFRLALNPAKSIERTGIKPDIYIKNTFKDRLEGKDPQLDTAVAEIMKQLK